MLNTAQHTPAFLPTNTPPVLCVIIDTEEEFNWDAPFSRHNTKTESIASQRLAHKKVFDHFGIVPTYVVDWPVATTPAAYLILKGMMEEGRCEVGTHLHPWVSPPHTEEVNPFNSYAGNLSDKLEYEKLKLLTNAIETNFKRTPHVFKAGRYGLGHNTSKTLRQLGYLIDASIVPYTSFHADGGPDFSHFDHHAYWFGPEEQQLLEIPVTTSFCGLLRKFGQDIYPTFSTSLATLMHIGGIFARSRILERVRLTPEGVDTSANQRLMASLVKSGIKILTLTYHSPSLVPGNTPYVRTQNELNQFLTRLYECCYYFQQELGGIFMSHEDVYKVLLEIKKNLITNE